MSRKQLIQINAPCNIQMYYSHTFGNILKRWDHFRSLQTKRWRSKWQHLQTAWHRYHWSTLSDCLIWHHLRTHSCSHSWFYFSILILLLIGGLGCGCEFNLHVNVKRIQKHKVPRSWSHRHLWAAQHGCWKPFFVQEQQALLTTEPLLQSLIVIFK